MKLKLLSITGIILFFISPLLYAQQISLEVPYYLQGKDSSWADEALGNKSKLTIRTHGCALTSISMIVSYFLEKAVTPSVMNKWLKEHQGYQDGWSGGKYLGEVVLNWPSLTALDGGWVYTRFDWKVQPADLVLIKYYLDRKIPVVAEVVYKSAPHYIVLTGYDDGGFLMNDPEFPEEHRFSNAYNISDKWGSGPTRNINGIRVIYPDSLN